mgnify:CR=1 FL=1
MSGLTISLLWALLFIGGGIYLAYQRIDLRTSTVAAGLALAAYTVFGSGAWWWLIILWALFGLMQSLRAQGKDAPADVIEKRFNKAWQGADVTLTASRFMGDTQTTMAALELAVSGTI